MFPVKGPHQQSCCLGALGGPLCPDVLVPRQVLLLGALIILTPGPPRSHSWSCFLRPSRPSAGASLVPVVPAEPSAALTIVGPAAWGPRRD